MTEIKLNDFNREVDCTYEDEKYSVRDNGSVLRHPRVGKKPRPSDNHWTFGKTCPQKGYLHIAGAIIHRIVATAFHGEPPTKMHVVDHIDTNHQNNRPENLRWLTRLENVLLNPITVKRIELICGSIEAFLEDPSILGDCKFDRNFNWMRSVSVEEAKACKERLLQWADSDKRPSGGSLGEWVFKPIIPQRRLLKTSNLGMAKTTNAFQNMPIIFPDAIQTEEEELITLYAEKMKALGLVISDTPGAVQRNWATPTEFPCCPQGDDDPITVYAEKLVTGTIFARNQFSTSVIIEKAIIDDGQSILVMCEQLETNAIKPWSLAKITHEDGLYVHTSLGKFFEKLGVEKQFCLKRGHKWTGDETLTFDELCG